MDEEKIRAAAEVMAAQFYGDLKNRAAAAYLLGQFLIDINSMALSLSCISSIMIEHDEAMMDEQNAACLHAAEPEGSA